MAASATRSLLYRPLSLSLSRSLTLYLSRSLPLYLSGFTSLFLTLSPIYLPAPSLSLISPSPPFSLRVVFIFRRRSRLDLRSPLATSDRWRTSRWRRRRPGRGRRRQMPRQTQGPSVQVEPDKSAGGRPPYSSRQKLRGDAEKNSHRAPGSGSGSPNRKVPLGNGWLYVAEALPESCFIFGNEARPEIGGLVSVVEPRRSEAGVEAEWRLVTTVSRPCGEEPAEPD